MRRMLLLCCLALVVFSCGKSKPEPLTSDELGRALLRGFVSNDYTSIQDILTPTDVYNAYGQAVQARFKTDVNPGFDNGSSEGRMAETRTYFDQARAWGTEQLGIDWTQATFTAVTLSDSPIELDGYTDYQALDVWFDYNGQTYRISTYGAVNEQGSFWLKPCHFRVLLDRS